MADSLPKLGLILWVSELSTSEDVESSFTSLALSPGFVTNTLLGLSWPVGKGPRGLPEKPPPLLGSGTFTLGDGGK